MPNLTPNYSFFLPLVDDPTDQDLWGGYLNDNFSSLDTLLANLTPSGVVANTAATSAPTGWLLCAGQAVNRATYAALFSAIGTTYGSGDGSTTFNVPDARGRVLAGVDNMGGTAANRITVANSGIAGTTLGAAGGNEQMQAHSHVATVTDPSHTHTYSKSLSVGGIAAGAGSGFNTTENATTSAASTGITVANGNTGNGNTQNVQPTLMLNVIIKT